MRIGKKLTAIIAGVTMLLGMAVSTQAAHIKATDSNPYTSKSNVTYLLAAGKNDYYASIKFKNMSTGKSKKVTVNNTKGTVTLGSGVWYETTVRGLDYYKNPINKTKTYVAVSPKLSLSMGNNTNMVVNWNKVKGSNGYLVYMSSDNGSTYKKVAKYTNPNITSYTTGTLTKYKNYYFYVRAYKKVGRKTYYSGKPTKSQGGYIYTTWR